MPQTSSLPDFTDFGFEPEWLSLRLLWLVRLLERPRVSSVANLLVFPSMLQSCLLLLQLFSLFTLISSQTSTSAGTMKDAASSTLA